MHQSMLNTTLYKLARVEKGRISAQPQVATRYTLKVRNIKTIVYLFIAPVINKILFNLHNQF